MRNPPYSHAMKTRARPGTGLVSTALALSLPMLAVGASATPVKGLDGYAVLRMCQGAEQVKSLDVMCNSYLNGFIDTLAYLGRRGARTDPAFCLGQGDKARVPTVLVVWLNAHPEAQAQPAPAVLHKVLAESFPCRRR
jgi:Rap1a immunity proteins